MELMAVYHEAMATRTLLRRKFADGLDVWKQMICKMSSRVWMTWFPSSHRRLK
jgi:hypothetical protein